MMKIRVLSFDFDGCLFNINYANSLQVAQARTLNDIRKDVLTHNEELLNQIESENSEFEQIVTMIGSNRQSWELDVMNWGYRKDSCFPAIVAVTEKLGATLDPFLLADISSNREAGTAFDLAMQALEHPEQNISAHPILSEEHYSRTKIMLLYVQMHRQAHLHPEDDVSFDFYDDKLGILDSIDGFFRKYPDLIPKNVTLRSHLYSGENTCQSYPVLKAQPDAMIDAQYKFNFGELRGIERLFNHYVTNPEETEKMSVWRTHRVPFVVDAGVPLSAAAAGSASLVAATGSSDAVLSSPAAESLPSVEVTDRIRVLSFDFDGCLFNLDYINAHVYAGMPRTLEEIRDDVLEFNQHFLESVSRQNAEFDRVITMIGSNRQSRDDDECNAVVANKGSCFPAIEAVTAKLKAKFDPFLLADADCLREPGTAFRLAMHALSHPDAPLTDCIAGEDEHLGLAPNYAKTKIALLYAQMHRQALAHPQNSISFDFYDDREDILGDISYFFERYPDLIPKNMTLTLHRYVGGTSCETTAVLHASEDSMIDTDYEFNICRLSRNCIQIENKVLQRNLALDEAISAWRNSRIPLLLTEQASSPADVEREVTLVDESIGASEAPVNTPIDGQEDAVLCQVGFNAEVTSSPEYRALSLAMKKLMEYGDTLESQGATEKAMLVRYHAKRLTSMLNEFFNVSQDAKSFRAFKAEFIGALHAEDKNMSLHRAQWKPILANIALALTVVGALLMAGYACYGVVSSKINKEPVTLGRCMLFFSTHSMHRVDEVGVKFKQCADVIDKNEVRSSLIG